LPAFVALAVGAALSGQVAVTDPHAMWVLYARIGQSLRHVVSTSVPGPREMTSARAATS
jgi:hypothetical protein